MEVIGEVVDTKEIMTLVIEGGEEEEEEEEMMESIHLITEVTMKEGGVEDIEDQKEETEVIEGRKEEEEGQPLLSRGIRMLQGRN